MSHFLVTMIHGPQFDSTRGLREQDGWNEHADFMDGLVDEGLVVLGGPIGEGERAMLIFEADGEGTIRDRMALDPWLPMGVLEIGRIEPWTIWLDGVGLRDPR
jgi:hypothetical protein